MKIYKVTRTDLWSYDDFDSFVCVAPDMETAKRLIPAHGYQERIETHTWAEKDKGEYFHAWTADKNAVKVELLGIADATFDKTKILLASFNAG